MTSERLHIKICGMREPANITQIASLGVDYLGFIFYKLSPRFVGENFLMPELPSNIEKVGVFVNESVDEIVRTTDRYQITTVQLHGTEGVDVCQQLRANGLRVIKVFSVSETFDFSETKNYNSVADYFLFDTKGKYFGGNSNRFDWKLLAAFDGGKPFFLSGGLTPENIGEIAALTTATPYAIDVNSGVEISPGLKDSDKVRQVKRKVDELNEALKKLNN